LGRTSPSVGAGRLLPSRVTRAGIGWLAGAGHGAGGVGLGVGYGALG